MSRVRGLGNAATELAMVALLKQHRIAGWRRHWPLFGHPDFVFRKERVAFFVDGCFWHRHRGCKFSYTPKSRKEFWLPKFERNVARDRLVTRTLRQAGWRVVRIWECQLTPKKQARVIAQTAKSAGGSAEAEAVGRKFISAGRRDRRARRTRSPAIGFEMLIDSKEERLSQKVNPDQAGKPPLNRSQFTRLKP